MIKKDKIYELKIEEDDEVSGVDSISLVDEPAIEVNWVAFNKEKEHEFHIPEGQDAAYVEKLLSVAKSEKELFEDGFEIDEIEYLNKEYFARTTPNAKSELDTPEYRIRYKYTLNPAASGNKIIDTTRQFCKELCTEDLVWRVEDMLKQKNSFGQSAFVWRGGYNCRHIWAKIRYKKKGYIENNAAYTDIVDYTILGIPQPDTRTKNPSFSKEEFAKVSLDYDGTLSTTRGQVLAKSLLTHGNDVYIVTARHSSDSGPVYKIADELGISHSKVHFTGGAPKWRTLSNLGIKKHYDNNPNVIAEIKKNLKDVAAEQFDYNVGTIGGYVDPGIDEKKKKKGFGLEHFAADSEKRMVLGPAMVPDMEIFRKDKQGNPYYVFFTAETIKMIAEKYMRNKYLDNNDQMHDGTAVKDVYVVESWIKESEHDKSTAYGFESMPIGTWFVSMKVNNPEIWSKVKNGELNGFSVSGFFEEVADFSMELAFLSELADLLRDIE
jgi:hypothetical protein